MRSATTAEFWARYEKLDANLKKSARKAYALWLDNPFHSSLHFKCINSKERIWAVRISRGHRALGLMSDDAVTWFWIGNHDDYEKFFG
ncbi:MAG: hypothetical protein ABI791_08235 [Acidobacteriota bacterium]